MSQSYTAPSTVDGIKRLAKALKREHGIPLHEAQARAAKIAGFQNLRHAQNQLAGRLPQPTAVHRLFITVYWSDREAGSEGRETLTTSLAVPFDSMTNTRAMREARALSRFRRAAADHIQFEMVVPRQQLARTIGISAERTLQFMAATGLRPANRSGRRKLYSKMSTSLPGEDHASVWVTPATGRLVMIDEPYELAVADREAERMRWAERHGFRIVKPSWGGLYSPGDSTMFLIGAASGGMDLDGLAAVINRMPAARSDDDWSGESAPFRPVWVSPADNPSRRRPATPLDPSVPPRKAARSVGYGGVLVALKSRRPDARMPIEGHIEAGKLLQTITSVSRGRDSVHRPLDHVRSELDEWVQREYSRHELANDVFSTMYYHQEPDMRSMDAQDRVAYCRDTVPKIRALVATHYPDCAPRRAMLNKLAIAERALDRWKA